MSLARLLPVLACTILCASSAHADEPTVEAAPPVAALGPDVRLPMIVTDLAAMGAFAASWSLGHAGSLGPNFARVGEGVSYAVFVGSGALYHEAADLRRRTVLSLVVRALAPVVFGGFGALAVHDGESKACKKDGIEESACDHDGTQTGAMVGALFGMLGATVAEATVIVPDARTPPPPRTAGVRLTPTASVQGAGGLVGVLGTF